jgi:hypothetical protein
MNISKDYLSTVAPNDAALRNGEGLVKKNSFSGLTASGDGTYIGGLCSGSGANPYNCSADFIDPASPVFRCSCPSRQIPCKHVIGLLFAFADGRHFNEGEIPEDILDKRKKKEQRASAKETTSNDAPPKDTPARRRAALKKIEAQLSGLEEAEKIIHNITQAGLGTLDARKAQTIRSLVKQLDSYYIPGIQSELYDLLGIFGQGGEVPYHQCTNKIVRLHILITRARAYFEKKQESPDQMDTGSEIEELTGYPWKLEELHQYNLFEKDARLLQLCFHVLREDDKARFVDEGFYISLNTGQLVKTHNYRPYKALKYIKEDDSVFQLIHVPELFIYPSRSVNPRARWDAFTLEEPTLCAYEETLKHARESIDEVVKEVKNQLKDLLLFEHPAVLVRCNTLMRLKSDSDEFVMEDSRGRSLTLKPNAYCRDNFLSMLDRLPPTVVSGCAMLLLFDNDVETGLLTAQPLAVITNQGVIRLVF